MRSGVACLGLIPILLCSCSTPRQRNNLDSPDVLKAQLNYAESLLSGDRGNCEIRLERAQQQLGSVGANPQTRVMYPEGWATVADLEYRLHLARAECRGDTYRDEELRIAVDSARRAVELYRNLFDYHSMVVMQFDASVALHDLGESSAAITALEGALDMDREYGFADDAMENYKLLLTWRGEPASDSQVATLMQDFPKRQVVMKFGWSARAAQMTLESRRACLSNGQLAASRAAAVFDRQIAATNEGGWAVSYANRLTQYEPGVWPTTPGKPPMAFPPAVIPEVGYKVGATGEFDVVTESGTFAAELATRTEELIRTSAPAGKQARDLMEAAVETAPENLSPGILEAATAENYQSETAMWIGATLEQGVWYEVGAPLTLPGMPRIVTQHRIKFAFTRLVPCSAAATEPVCAEIVMRITPDEEALARLLADYNNRTEGPRIDNYTSSNTTRIVTDPTTLLPFARERHVIWSAALTDGQSVLQSEHLVSTVRYSGWPE
ncbi:MAG TPA: hypothetical protein VGI23_28460 [Steroidobacteraceae bacterium]